MTRIEPLDSRILFATISGYVWNDIDRSATQDDNEARLANVVVFIDRNHDRIRQSNEQRTVTDATGNYSFNNLSAGTYDIVQVPPSTMGQAWPNRFGRVQSGFNITLNYSATFTPSQYRAFEEAKQIWEAIITSDLPDDATSEGSVDDIRINITKFNIDGASGTLAQGDALETRAGSLLPSLGMMEMDSSDIDDLESEGKLVETITHEMAHALGFGTIWQEKNLIAGATGSTPRFIGAKALAAYNQLFNVSAAGVPLENDGGSGTDLSHWRESTFTNEQMTGFTENVGVIEPISLVTVQSFADMGYTVSPAAADAYNPVTRTGSHWTPLQAGVPGFSTRVSVLGSDVQDTINFGNRINHVPGLKNFAPTASQFNRGEIISMSTRSADADGDAIIGVTFYRESNGVAGLQVGSDSYIVNRTAPKRGYYRASTFSDALSAGNYVFYAVSTDDLGSSTTGTITVAIADKPNRPTNLVATPKSASTTLLTWRDRSNNEDYFRIELSTSSSFTSPRRINSAANTSSLNITGLTNGATYYYRIRAFNTLGGSSWTTSLGIIQTA